MDIVRSCLLLITCVKKKGNVQDADTGAEDKSKGLEEYDTRR